MAKGLEVRLGSQVPTMQALGDDGILDIKKLEVEYVTNSAWEKTAAMYPSIV